MKITYDKEVDAVYIQLTDKPKKVEYNQEYENGVFDYDKDDNKIGIEILNFSNVADVEKGLEI